jgi:hypothetical protein
MAAVSKSGIEDADLLERDGQCYGHCYGGVAASDEKEEWATSKAASGVQ